MRMAGLKHPLILTLMMACLVAWPAQAQTIRGHGPHGGGGHGGTVAHAHYHPYPYYGYPYYPFYPYGYFGFTYYSYAYPPYAHPYAYYGGAPGNASAAEVGWVDTDVSPEKAQVYVDGKYVGVADNFDGYPGFLALGTGRHTISFKSPDRQTFTRTIDVVGGALLNFDFTMARLGKGEKPQEVEEPAVPPPSNGYQNGHQKGNGDDLGLSTDESAAEEAPASLRLGITPPDASVYIDGEFIGTGSALQRLHGSLRLDSGHHVVEVARPGYRSASREVRLAPGQRSSLEIVLERD